MLWTTGCCLSCISLNVRVTRSTVLVKDNEFLNYLRATIGNAPPAPLVYVLKSVLANSIQLLACNYYIYSLGEVRFTRYQRLFLVYDRLFINPSSPMSVPSSPSSCAVSCFPWTTSSGELTSTFLYGLDQHLTENDHESAVGRHLMSSFLIICIITLCYERSFVAHDMDVGTAGGIECRAS